LLAVLDEFNRAWNDHDLEAAMALVTEDCVFESTGRAPDGERHAGRAAVRLAWEPIFADASTRFAVEEAVACGDGRLVQRWRYDWGDGHIRGIDLIRVRDGLVAEKLSYVKG
jgi:uncharacterized protein (TIGR02246 family)